MASLGSLKVELIFLYASVCFQAVKQNFLDKLTFFVIGNLADFRIVLYEHLIHGLI